MENGLVVKNNNLIQARYDLSLNEQKIILYAVSKLDRDKDRFNILQIQASEFFKLLGTTQERYTEIRDIASELMKKQVRIETEKSDLVANWLSSIEYMNNSGVIELEFSEKLIPYLLQLKKNFTRYQLENILNLKSKYSIRIYELLKQYEKIGKREFKLKELRNILSIEDDEYLRFDNLDRVILQKSKEEINKHTDINISYEKIKTGRRITSILFKIEPKDQEKEIYVEYLNECYNIKDIQLKTGLKEENFNAEQIIEIYSRAVKKLENEEEKDIFEYIRLNYNHIKNKATNRYGYLLKALDNDYASARGQIKFDYCIENKNN